MELYAGVDVGKNDLDLYFSGESMRFSNNNQGIKKLIAYLQGKKDFKLAVFEATGGYEEWLQKALIDAGLSYHKAHPNKVRKFAESVGRYAKTDKLDAKVLSEYGRIYEVSANQSLQTEDGAQLKSLLTRRDQLIAEKIQEGNRLDKMLSKVATHSIKSHIKWLEKEIERIEKETKDHIDSHPELKEQIKLYRSVPGVGFITAATLLANLPELGKEEHKQISALVGVVPMNRDSGKKRGKRSITGGRAAVRKVLYMAALAATRSNKTMKEFYQRLKQKGKESKVALTAAMRKLIIMLNSVAKRGTPWQEVFIRC